MRMYPYSNNLATLFILSDLNSVSYSLDIYSVPYCVLSSHLVLNRQVISQHIIFYLYRV
jgi:hypothetical protein